MLKLRIVQDEDPIDVRKEYDHLGKMLCLHGRYRLGDATELKSEDFNSWKEVKEYLIKVEQAEVILPLYLLDHSGISMSTSDFNDRWDSGQIGFIYATREAILKEYGRKRVTEVLRKRVRLVLEAEVAEYDQYLQGDVWGYVIEDDNGEHVDSCWGFYGRENAEWEGGVALKYWKNKKMAETGAAGGCD